MAKKLTLILLCLMLAAVAATAVTLGLVYGKDGGETSQNTEQNGGETSNGGTVSDSANSSTAGNQNSNTGSGNTSGNSGNNSGSGNTSGSGTNGGSGSGSGNTSGSGTNGGSNSGSGNTGNTSGSGGNNNGNNNTPHVCTFTFTSTVAPDCLNGGYDLYSCTCGQTQQRNPVQSLGHSLTYKVTSAATCAKEGSETGTCSTCGANFVRSIPKTAHTYGAYKFNNDATCTKDGTESATCSGCGKKDTRTVVGSKTAHNFSGGVCSNCGAKDDASGLEFTDYGTYSEVTGIGTASGDIVVPATHNGLPVTGINWVFNARDDITSITLPDSVGIAPDEFFGCKNLKKVVLGTEVAVIGVNIFWKCSSLESITISGNLTEIDAYAFAECTSLKEIIFLGTKAQWNAVVKENDWNYNTGNYVVKCTDGNISK